MLSDQAMNGILAVALGAVVAVLLLIPVAAVQYRRDGAFSIGDVLTLLGAAVYGLALWTYTLLPMPATGDFTCKSAQLELFGSFRPIWEHGFDGPAALLRDAAFLQVGLNVALFVPFGFFVRKILSRGFVVATLLGFAMSLLIETTQRTGVWGLYDCPYRLFDVDDLLTNTAGALIGSLVSVVLVARAPKEVRLPEHVTRGRRWVSMVCDVVFMFLLSSLVQVAYRAWQIYVGGGLGAIDTDLQAALGWGTAAAAQLVTVLLLGRTVGEWTVDLRTVAARRALALPGRLVKFATGTGAFAFLAWWPFEASSLLLGAFALATFAATFPGRNHPGLANTLGGLRLEVDLPSPRG
ncbi:MAG: VanZ family protein [Nocardioides sp.]|uniref:VanZ family protein n=1 Tax=Nocardioides sp. TaxID=35761 RepID=UPI003F0C12D0